MNEKSRKTAAIWLLGFGIIIPLFNIWAVWVLRKLCSSPLRLFFKRFWIVTLLPWGLYLLSILLGFIYTYALQEGLISPSEDINIPQLLPFFGYLISFIFGIFIMIFLMSGSELITRYYRLDFQTASKVRLFQMSALLFPFFNLICPAANLFTFIALKGMIRTDLLSEERYTEEYGEVKVRWWSCPVKAMVCFYVCLSVLVGLTVIIGTNF